MSFFEGVKLIVSQYYMLFLRGIAVTMLISMIGIENVVNSFCHIRMPVLVTTLSSIYSLIFAIIIGSIGVVVVYKVMSKLKGGSLKR